MPKIEISAMRVSLFEDTFEPALEISAMQVSLFEDTFEPALEFTAKIPLQQPKVGEDLNFTYEEIGRSLITALLKRANLQIDDLGIPEIK